MRILFTMGHAYFPQRGGGAQSNTHELVKALRRLGHEVGVACMLSGGGWTEARSRVLRTLTGARFSCDSFDGYPVYRAWDPSDLREVVTKFKPDIAVVQNGATVLMARGLEISLVPTVLYFHNVEFDDLGGQPSDLLTTTFVANSIFTASRVREKFKIESTIIRPFVEPSRYRTETTRENVTFINPYPEKGVDIALAVAERCHDIPFRFVESWGLPAEMRAEFDRKLAALPNASFSPRTSDMTSIYGRARLVLAPSRWEEAWGRIATEAHCSGIPVVGSAQGGLPEAIGPGGLAIPIDATIDRWVHAVRLLWDDDNEYARFSGAATAFGRRPEIQPHFQVRQLLETLEIAIARQGLAVASESPT